MAAWFAGAVILVAWYGVLAATGGDLFGRFSDALNLAAFVVAGGVSGVVASRRGSRFKRSILAGALLAVVPAAICGVLEWTAKPSIIILVPSGPRVAPLVALFMFCYALLPSVVGATVGWNVARRRSARHSA